MCELGINGHLKKNHPLVREMVTQLKQHLQIKALLEWTDNTGRIKSLGTVEEQINRIKKMLRFMEVVPKPPIYQQMHFKYHEL